MNCTRCQAVNPEANRYCESCGLALRLVCRKCGEESSPRARFCGSCGTAHGPGPEQAALSLLPVAELKQATILFADIVGSTELVAALDPEQAMQRLNPAVSIMVNAVRRYDGTIGRTLGDGIMAFFGAPRGHEGHALLACQAALEMLAESQRGAGLDIRVGLHSGEVVSDQNDAQDGERQMHGLAIHLASRVAALADPGTIYLSEDCHLLARSYYDTLALGAKALRGIAHPVHVYRLTGQKSPISGNAFRGGGRTRLHGREREIEALTSALAFVEQGGARVVGVAGAPGTGKSRLCFEFTNWCRQRLIPVHETRAQLYGHATPLQPILELLRSVFFRISPSDEPAVARSRIAQHIREMGQPFEVDLPLLNDFLGVPESDAPPPSLSPKARHARLLGIVRHMVRHQGDRTSVILIEDLHWLDSASEDFMATLADAVAGTRTMLVVNYRPSFSAAWMQSPAFQQIVLGELNATSMMSLVEELIGGRREVHEIAERVAQRSGGNPFFAEELVRSLASAGTLVGYSALPATVQAVIGARIDRLSASQKALLQVCSILGKEFPVAVLGRVADESARQLEEDLLQLCETEFLQLQPNPEDRCYAFRHPLIQEVAYRTQLKATRSPLHARVAQTMESFYAHRLDEYSGLLAHHYEAAEQPLNAARYSARAAAWVGSTDSAQAVRHWHKVRSLLKDQPRNTRNDALRSQASGQIAWLGWREGVTAEAARPFIEEALARAGEADRSMIPLLLFVEGRLDIASGGSADLYVARLKKGLAVLEGGGNEGRSATVNAALSHAYGWAGLLNEALAANSAAIGALAAIEAFDNQFIGFSVEHWTISLRGRLLARLGRHADARLCLDSMLAIEPGRIDPAVQFIANVGYIDIAWARGEPELAQRHATEIVRTAERQPNAYLRVVSHDCMGLAKSIGGDFSGAIDQYREGLRLIAESKAAMETESEMLAGLAECYLKAGDDAKAIATAGEAISLSRARAARLSELRASLTRGAALAASPGPDAALEARALLDRAEDLIAQSGVAAHGPALERARALLSATVDR